MAQTASELLKDCQDFLDGLEKGDFKDKGQFYAAEDLRNRLRALRLKSDIDTKTVKGKEGKTKSGT